MERVPTEMRGQLLLAHRRQLVEGSPTEQVSNPLRTQIRKSSNSNLGNQKFRIDFQGGGKAQSTRSEVTSTVHHV